MRHVTARFSLSALVCLIVEFIAGIIENLQLSLSNFHVYTEKRLLKLFSSSYYSSHILDKIGVANSELKMSVRTQQLSNYNDRCCQKNSREYDLISCDCLEVAQDDVNDNDIWTRQVDVSSTALPSAVDRKRLSSKSDPGGQVRYTNMNDFVFYVILSSLYCSIPVVNAKGTAVMGAAAGGTDSSKIILPLSSMHLVIRHNTDWIIA
jgi:hypothetical protein